jgi:hypothetical protein
LFGLNAKDVRGIMSKKVIKNKCEQLKKKCRNIICDICDHFYFANGQGKRGKDTITWLRCERCSKEFFRNERTQQIDEIQLPENNKECS